MSRNTLKLMAETTDEHVVLLAPMVGVVRLTVADGQVINPEQIVGSLTRLNKQFSLVFSGNTLGVVRLKNNTKVRSCGYKEELFSVEPLRGATHVNNAKITEPSSHNFITSPMDGLLYLSSSPEEPPFIKIGDEVAPGQTIGLIEVMKCFYPFKYQGPNKVTVTRICVFDKSPVQSGEKVFEIGCNPEK